MAHDSFEEDYELASGKSCHITQAQAAEWHTYLVDEEKENKSLRAEIAKLKARCERLTEALKDTITVLDRFEETQDEDSFSSCYYNARMCGDSFWIPVNRARAAIAESEE